MALAHGTSRSELADKTGLAKKTMDVHAANLFRKIGARNSLDAVRLAVVYGLIKLPIAAPDSVTITNPEGKLHKAAP